VDLEDEDEDEGFDLVMQSFLISMGGHLNLLYRVFTSCLFLR